MSVVGKSLDRLVAEHPLFADLEAPYLELIAGCAKNVRFEAGERIFREGGKADEFYLVRHGQVAVEVFAPGRGSITIETLHAGQVLGWSWLLPPYRWHHDARAVELTRALAFDAECLRGKSDRDARFGLELMRRFAPLIVQRLERAELQLLDVYGRD